MKTKLSINNPFGYSIRMDHAVAWEYVNNCIEYNVDVSMLDYGAYDGKMLCKFLETGVIKRGVGVDLNRKVVDQFSPLLPAEIQLKHIEKNSDMPFDDDTFDIVTVMGVLEHVCNQDGLLLRLNRVLKKDGYLIISVPGKNFFSFLDFANWKFNFPYLHKLYITMKHGKNYYFERYVKCESDMIGDIEIGKAWHQHFKLDELIALVEKNNFSISYYDGFGFYFRVLHNIHYMLPFFKEILYKLMILELRKFSSAELFLVAQKKG